MPVSAGCVEVHSCLVRGYASLVDHESWRVASVCKREDEAIDRLKKVHRHLKTDEVFVLLQGAATLFVAEESRKSDAWCEVPMEQLTLYRVKRGVWHACVLQPDSTVLIVENSDTNEGNSEYAEIEGTQVASGRAMPFPSGRLV